MSDLLNISKEYKELLGEIGLKFKNSQIKAATKVNEEMLEFYYWLGCKIYVLKESMDVGNSIYQKLSKDLVETFPDVKSFSVTNLKYMQYFYELYSSPQVEDSGLNQISPQVGDLRKIGIAGFILWLCVRSNRNEKKRIVDEIIGPDATNRLDKMVDLLGKFNIDMKDDKQIDMLIERAKKEQESYDIWKDTRNLFKGMTTYILLPIITIFVSELFKDTDPIIVIKRATVLIFVCVIGVLLISAFSTNFSDIFNPDKRKLDYFIEDLENVKLFGVRKKTDKYT